MSAYLEYFNTLERVRSVEPRVIATTVGGIPEVVAHGETGFLFEAKDVQALEVHLRTLLGDRAMALRMGKAGRERVLARHSWERNAREHIRIYQTLLGDR